MVRGFCCYCYVVIIDKRIFVGAEHLYSFQVHPQESLRQVVLTAVEWVQFHLIKAKLSAKHVVKWNSVSLN